MIRVKQKAVVKLSDGSVFESGTLPGAKRAAEKYARNTAKRSLYGNVEMTTSFGKHIQYSDEWFGMHETHAKAKISDVESGHPDVEVRVVITDHGIELYIPGYGTRGMENGHGSPVYLEIQKGIPRLLIWSDIQTESPTDVIGLGLSAESLRTD